jgi:hypothetical protein
MLDILDNNGIEFTVPNTQGLKRKNNLNAFLKRNFDSFKSERTWKATNQVQNQLNVMKRYLHHLSNMTLCFGQVEDS